LHPSWVIICSGGIFFNDVGKALEELGFSLYTLDVKKLSLEEMETTIRRFDPQVVFAISKESTPRGRGFVWSPLEGGQKRALRSQGCWSNGVMIWD